MNGTLLNDFLVGADPEMVLLDPPALVNGMQARLTTANFYGWDHNGYVLEPHPTPSKSVREVIYNIRKALHVVGYQFDKYKFRAGAYLNTPQRVITLGGHVHLDLKQLNAAQIAAMDTFAASLEALDILPAAECQQRSQGGAYGRKSDIRNEHGHVEYRSLCSWLFSQKTSMLCMTGIKLCAIAPATVKPVTSYKALLTWLEGFKGKDDDVDWILRKEYLKVSSSMEAKPDNNIKAVWRIDNDCGGRLLQKAADAAQTAATVGFLPVRAPYNAIAFDMQHYVRRYRANHGRNPEADEILGARRIHDAREVRLADRAINEMAANTAHNLAVTRAQEAMAAARAAEQVPPEDDGTGDWDDEEVEE